MVETMNNIGNRQPDSNAGCSKQKGVKNKQTRQLVLWIGALIVGAVLGIFGISWLDSLMNFIATVYTRLFQLLAVPTIALAVITTLASLGNQADTGKIFRHAITYTLLTTIAAAAVGLVLVQHRCSRQFTYSLGTERYGGCSPKAGRNQLL